MIRDQPKVLVACPTSSFKDYCMYDFVSHVKQLTYPDYDVYMVDNSYDPEYHKKIEACGIECDYVAPDGRESRFYMAECNELIRQKALVEGYDFIMSLESDLFPPKNIIELLMDHDRPVVSAPYFISSGVYSYLMLQHIEFFGEKDPLWRKLKTRNCDNIESFFYMDGTLKQSFANGIGCTLIRSDVFSKIRFRVTENNVGHADSFFYQDLYANGIPSFVDTSLIIEHKNQDWGFISDNINN